MQRKIVFIVCAALMFLTAIPDAEAKKGFYLGLGAAYNTIGGDFNGAGGLRSGDEMIVLPDINRAAGIDIRGGYGITDRWAVELNVISSNHRGTWAGRGFDVMYTYFSINGKYNFLSSKMVQPYLQFGFGPNELVIKKGAAKTSTGEVRNATLSGPGANFGAGVDLYLGQHVSLNLGVMYRYVTYTDASGVDHSGTINDSLDGSGLSFLVTTAYHF